MLTPDERTVLSMRSDRNKIGIPVNRLCAPPRLLAAAERLIERGWLLHIDQAYLPDVGGLLADVYLLSPAATAALETA